MTRTKPLHRAMEKSRNNREFFLQLAKDYPEGPYAALASKCSRDLAHQANNIGRKA